jgi:S1-C subfamily serine protease
MVPMVQTLIDAGYPIRRVDVTTEPDLAARFQVDRVPCFIMVHEGQEVDRFVGATSREHLLAMFQQVHDRVTREQDQRVRTQSPDTQPAGIFWTGVRGNEPQSRATVDPQVTPTAALAQTPLSQSPAMSPLDESSCKLLLSSVRLRVDETDGHSYGTGTIIDTRRDEALIITCGHIFRESEGRGPVTVELLERTPEGVRIADQVVGTVISYDLNRDIGLVSIRPGRSVRVAPIAPPRTVVQRGDRVQSVGCDHGKHPIVRLTRVTAVDRYQGPPNIEVDGAPVEGRSGGGLFNNQGELIGVCFAADYEGDEGLYAGLQSIHDELDRIGMSDVYRTAANDEPAAEEPAAVPSVVRGQEPLVPVTELRESFAAAATADESPVAAPAEEPVNLNSVEQAAWEEIMSRASESEVICIIRPKQPGAKSEVITLNGVSPEFVRALASRTAGGNSAGTVVR